MEAGFEKLFVRRGHPSDEVNDGELFHHGVTGSNMKMLSQNPQLTFKHFNKFCFNLEKKDLVELVLQHSQVSSPLDATESQSSRLSSSESYTDNSIRVSDQVSGLMLITSTLNLSKSTM